MCAICSARAGSGGRPRRLEGAGMVTLAVFLLLQSVNDHEALKVSVESVRGKDVFVS